MGRPQFANPTQNVEGEALTVANPEDIPIQSSVTIEPGETVGTFEERDVQVVEVDMEGSNRSTFDLFEEANMPTDGVIWDVKGMSFDLTPFSGDLWIYQKWVSNRVLDVSDDGGNLKWAHGELVDGIANHPTTAAAQARVADRVAIANPTLSELVFYSTGDDFDSVFHFHIEMIQIAEE